MKKDKHPSQYQGNITAGNISNSKGVTIGHESSSTVNEGISGQDAVSLFQILMSRVNELPDGPSKVVAQQAVAGLEQEVQKGENAQEEKVKGWFNFLAQAAPDVWDVAVSTLANPIAGVAKVVQLVAQKAAEEKEKNKKI